MVLHHIGIIVNDIESALAYYTFLGYEQINTLTFDDIQMNNIVFLSAGCQPYIELIQPVNEKSTVYNAKTGFHHLAYDIRNDLETIAFVKKNRLGKKIYGPVQAPCIENRWIVFFYMKNQIIYEFIK